MPKNQTQGTENGRWHVFVNVITICESQGESFTLMLPHLFTLYMLTQSFRHVHHHTHTQTKKKVPIYRPTLRKDVHLGYVWAAYSAQDSNQCKPYPKQACADLWSCYET